MTVSHPTFATTPRNKDTDVYATHHAGRSRPQIPDVQDGRESPEHRVEKRRMPVPLAERLWTVDQLAELWQISPRSIRRMIADGRLPVVRLGRAVRIPAKSVSL